MRSAFEMARGRLLAALIVTVAGVPVASAQGPLLVSPGSAVGATMVAERCPTFSWGSLEGVSQLELTIYRLPPSESPASIEEPKTALRVALPGAATSWTPPLARCLEPGGRYAWALQALRDGAESEWSEVRLFDVTAAPSIADVDEALAVLRRYREASRDLLTEAEGSAESRPAGQAGRSPGVGAAAIRPGEVEEPVREGDAASAIRDRLDPLLSSTVGAEPPPRTVTPPGYYSLSVSGDLALGGAIFKTGYPFLHNDGVYGFGNTGLGVNALISSTPGVPGYGDGKNNTALGENALRENTTGEQNTAVGTDALLFNTSGEFNTAVGRSALALNQGGSRNTGVGVGALFSNLGTENTAIGFEALRSNTTGGENTATGVQALHSNTLGKENTATGYAALRSNASGDYNTALGHEALSGNTSGAGNTATGSGALVSSTSGHANTALGRLTLGLNLTGSSNTAVGAVALVSNTAGDFNTAIGRDALSNSTGSNNTALGYRAGYGSTTGSDNIFIGNTGIADDAATLRIGAGLSRAFISGIRSVTTGNMNAVTVVIDTEGQLGTASSSRRFKQDIENMGDASSGLLDLRPVTFRYKQKALDGEQLPTYGLIAEEVLEIFPDLVAFDAEGRPETVLYRLLTPMLVNELQKQARENKAQAEELRRLQKFVLGLGSSARVEANDETSQFARADARPGALPGIA